jgi:uncharacterized protein YrrD
MIVKGNHMIGLKVFSIREGKYMGTISDAIYDSSHNKARAFLLKSSGVIGEQAVLSLADLKTIGPDAVLIESEEAVGLASELSPRLSSMIENDTYFTRTKVVTDDGTDLGTVSDVYFDTYTGSIVELEISGGPFEDMRSGKKRIELTDVITLGPDVTIVQAQTKEKLQLQAQEQGVQGALKRTRETMHQKTPVLRQRAQEFGKRTRSDLEQFKKEAAEKASEFRSHPKTQQSIELLKQQAEEAKHLVHEKFLQLQKSIHKTKINYAVGKYISKNVLLPNDELLAKRGDLITYEMLEKAKKNHIEEQILNNATSEPLQLSPSDI